MQIFFRSQFSPNIWRELNSENFLHLFFRVLIFLNKNKNAFGSPKTPKPHCSFDRFAQTLAGAGSELSLLLSIPKSFCWGVKMRILPRPLNTIPRFKAKANTSLNICHHRKWELDRYYSDFRDGITLFIIKCNGTFFKHSLIGLY